MSVVCPKWYRTRTIEACRRYASSGTEQVPLEACRQYLEVVPNKYHLRHARCVPQVVPNKYHLRHVVSMPQVVPNKYHFRHVVSMPQVVPNVVVVVAYLSAAGLWHMCRQSTCCVFVSGRPAPPGGEACVSCMWYQTSTT